MGIANETPSAVSAFMDEMPTTSPARLTNGPPELPLLMAASVCMNSVLGPANPSSTPCDHTASEPLHAAKSGRLQRASEQVDDRNRLFSTLDAPASSSQVMNIAVATDETSTTKMYKIACERLLRLPYNITFRSWNARGVISWRGL